MRSVVIARFNRAIQYSMIDVIEQSRRHGLLDAPLKARYDGIRGNLEVRKQALATLAVLLFLATLPCLAQEAGDAAHGARMFQYCFSCHSVDPNEKAQLQGPSLYHLIGRPAASLKGFDYSDAMKQRSAAGLVWNAATLDTYIADPQSVVPGTRMATVPVRDEKDRADLIAYLAKSGAWRP
jgi:cytochrome c